MITTILILQLTAALPPVGRCVMDEAGFLSSAEVQQLEQGCASVRGRFYITALSSTRGQGDQYARTLFRQWGVPSNGALVMVSPTDRKWRIVTGGDLRGTLTDAQAADIGRTYGVPAFRNQLWGTGLISIEHSIVPRMAIVPVAPSPPPVVTRRTTTTTTRRVLPVATAPYVYHGPSGLSILLVFLLTIGIIIGIIWFISWLSELSDARARRLAAVEEEIARKRAASAAAAAAARTQSWDTPSPIRGRVVTPPPVQAAPPVVVQAPAAPQVVIVPPPIVPPIVVAPSPVYPRRYGYGSPVIVDPIVPIIPIAPAIEETTTTVTEEVVSSPSDGGAGGGWSSSSDDDSGGSGGSIDDSSSSDSGDCGSSGDDGGSGGDF